MIERLLEMFARFLRKRGSYMGIPRVPGERTMDRYFLFRIKGRCGAMLHRSQGLDPQAPHDHPWGNRSILLSGSYVEHTYEPSPGGPTLIKSDIVTAPDISPRRMAVNIHRLESHGEKPCWTLFLYGRRVRKWGFHTKNGWLPGREGAPENDRTLKGIIFPRMVQI